MRYDPDFDTSTNDHRLDETYKRANSILEYELKIKKPWTVNVQTLPAGTISFTIHKNIKSYKWDAMEHGLKNPGDESDYKQLKLQNISSHRSNNSNYPENIMYDDIRYYYDKETRTLYIEKKA